MITYTELTHAVAGNIRINYNSADLARFQVVDNINAAIRSILTSFPVEFLSEAIITRRLNLLSGIDAYQWPSDWIRFVKAWAKYNASASYKECHEGGQGESDSDLNLDRQPRFAFPMIELNAERGFYVRPTPQADVTGGLRLRYIYQFPAVSATQNCMLDVKWKNLIVFRASALSAGVEGSKPDLVILFEKFDEKETSRFLPRSEAKQ